MMMTMMMMMMTVQITVQVVCKLKNHPQKQNVQDMIMFLHLQNTVHVTLYIIRRAFIS